MAELTDKTALVIGASTGIGKATVEALVVQGARVAAVARGEEGLAALRAGHGRAVTTHRGDAADPAVAEGLVRELRPELVVLSGGIRPVMGAVDELSWESFSETWNVDVKAAFHVVRGSLSLPLRPGSTVVLLSSGAAIQGSFLSGGYAGAKRMEWLLAGYAQKLSDARGLGLRFLAVLPRQLVEGTTIGRVASETYGRLGGKTGADYMAQWDAPLRPEGVAAAIVDGLAGRIAPGVIAVAVSGRGIEPLP